LNAGDAPIYPGYGCMDRYATGATSLRARTTLFWRDQISVEQNDSIFLEYYYSLFYKVAAHCIASWIFVWYNEYYFIDLHSSELLSGKAVERWTSLMVVVVTLG